MEGTGNKLILVAVDNIDISILSVVEKETIFGADKATESMQAPKKAHKRSLQRNIYAEYFAGMGREGKVQFFFFSLSKYWLVGPWGGDC